MSMGGGGRFFGAVLSHFASIVKKQGLTTRSVLVGSTIARMFARVKDLLRKESHRKLRMI